MSKLVKLARVEDVVEGKPVAVNPPGFPPLAAYRVGEEFFVTANLCTHGLALLTDGYQEAEVIECSFHGGAFDVRTGVPVAFPCNIAIQTFKVTVDDGHVCIEG